MKRILKAAAICSCLIITSACNHKDLCFDHIEHASRCATAVKISYDRHWEQAYDDMTDWPADWATLALDYAYDDLKPSEPEGVRLTSFNSSGKRTDVNLDARGEEIHLSPGANSLLFYNNDTEYIIFNDMGSYDDASATTRTRSRSSFNGNPFYRSPDGNLDEVTVAEPDVLYGHYIEQYNQERSPEAQQLGVTMRPLVFTYVIRHFFDHGYNHVALARGALSGMAAAVYLSDGHTSDDAVAVLYDCTLKPWGIEATVKSFGVPDFPNPDYSRSGDSHSYALNLELRLNNGKILNFNFDISDQLRRQPHGGVITVGGIDISDSEAEPDKGSGFDVSVEGWGEFEDVNIDF